MFVEDELLTLRRGQVLRISPGEMHGGYEDTSAPSFIWMHCDGALTEEMPNRVSSPLSFDRVLLLAKEVLHYAESDGYPDGITECILKALLAEISYKGAEVGSLISSVREWIKKNADKGLKVSCVADKFGYNKDYLNRIFSEKCGIGIKQYIDLVKTELIKREIAVGGYSLADIARRCGFEDYKYFLKYFRYHAGMSPGEYREAYYRMHTN